MSKYEHLYVVIEHEDGKRVDRRAERAVERPGTGAHSTGPGGAHNDRASRGKRVLGRTV